MIRLFFAFLVLSFSLGLRAETVPATSTATARDIHWYNATTKYRSVEGATFLTFCQALSSANGWTLSAARFSDGANSGACDVKKTSTGSLVSEYGDVTWHCVGDGTYSSNKNTPCATYVCPDSTYTLSGTNCVRATCKADQYVGSDGKCKCNSGADLGEDNATCCPVAGSGGGSPMMWCYVPNMAASNCDSKGANGCNVRCNNVTFQKGTGDNVQLFPKLALGQSCSFTGVKAGAGVGGNTLTNDELHEVDQATKKPEQAQTPAGCLASGQGYVTGSSGTTCVSGGDTGVVDKKTETESSNNNGQGTSTEKTTESTQGPNGTGTETTTSTTHNADGTTTVKTTTTSKNADGTVTKTESSVTKDSGGNVVDSKSNSSNKDGSTFCSENPNSAVCKGFEDTCKDNPGRLGCMDAGEVPNEGALPSREGGITGITPVSLSSVNVCPQGPPLPFGLGYFSFDGICQLAQGIRPVVLAMAWLSAALILIGAFRES